jgi:hypothetical protein
MTSEKTLRDLGERASRWWAGLDRGWRAVLLGHLVAAAIWVAI